MAADYIVRRGSYYHFRRWVPVKLRELIGKEVWQEPLKTTSRREAQQIVQPWITSTNEQIRKAQLEYQRTKHVLAMLTQEEREQIEYMGGFKGIRENLLANRHILPIADATAEMFAGVAKRPLGELDREGIDPDEVRRQEAEALTFRTQIQFEIDRDESFLARRGLKPNEVAPPLPSEPGKAPEIGLTDLVERWIAHKGVNQQHADQYRYPVKLFGQWHGTPRLSEITRAMVTDWRDGLMKMPRSTAKRYRTAPMRKAIDLAQTEGVPLITPKSVKKHVTALGTLLKFAVDEGHLQQNVAANVSIPMPKQKKSAVEGREGFTLEQRRHLFQVIGETYARDHDEFWIPHVALFQAMRAEEICQLLKSDIKQEAGIWSISVTDEGDDTRKVKNAASVRTIPIAPELLEMGFLGFVQQSPGPRVFVSLKPDGRGRLAASYGKRFARLLREKAGITDKRLVFHSLRGTWKDAARDAEVPTEVQEAFMGHTESGNPVAAKYGSGRGVETLFRWVEKVKPLG